MIVEERDPNSGAIRFKEDEDTKNLKYLLRTVKRLSETVTQLEDRVKVLESKQEKDS